jgi:hypothetical protein
MLNATPNALLHIQRHLNYEMALCRSVAGKPYFTYNGKSILYRKKDGFLIIDHATQKCTKTMKWQDALAKMQEHK